MTNSPSSASTPAADGRGAAPTPERLLHGDYDRRRAAPPHPPDLDAAAYPDDGGAAAAALASIHERGDRGMMALVGVHALLALALAPVHDTWRVTLAVTALAAGGFYLMRWRRPGSRSTRIAAGIALQAFVALHIHQMSGLAEMHFFYFTSVSAMVLYQDWRAMWPGIWAILLQHALFSVLHNAGVHPGGQQFFEPPHVGAGKLAWHFGVALAQAALAAYAAESLRRRTVGEARQRASVERANRALHEQQAELAATNAMLQEQHAELESQAEELAEQSALAAAARDAERVQRESAERFRALQDASPDGFMLFESVRDAQGAIVDFTWLYTNPAASALVGRPAAALEGRRLLEVMPGNREDGLFDAYVRVVESGEPMRREFHYAHEGLDHWFTNVAVKVADGFGVTFADVSARKRAEREAEQARRAAEEANRAKGEFLATMSHELRTPLNAIGGYTELLAMGIRGPVTEEQRLDLARIGKSQRHLLGLISDILNFARLEAGQVELRLEAVPVASLFESVEPLVVPMVEARALRLRWSIEGASSRALRADPDRLRQVLLNLVGNAVKFTEAGGEVSLVARTAGDAWVELLVRDTGRGIPPDRLEAIFEPFVQVDRRRTGEASQGVGLGLAISRDLVRAMGGEIGVASVPGEGSTFTVRLPSA